MANEHYLSTDSEGDPIRSMAMALEWATEGVGGGSLNELENDAPTGISVIECYDGTIREVPSDGKISGLTTSLWKSRSEALDTGSWIVLQFEGFNASADPFQIFLQQGSTANRLTWSVLKNADFVTGGGDTTEPDMPTVECGPVVDTTNMDALSTVQMWVDAGALHIKWQDPIVEDDQWLLNICENEGGSATDLYPIVMSDNLAYGGAQGDDNWWRTSPKDGTTTLVEGTLWFEHKHTAGALMNAPDPQYSDVHPRPRWRLGLGFEDASHQHKAGYFRLMDAINESSGSKATTAGKSRCIVAPDTGIMNYTFPWDSVTDYPPV